jgi:uncharacterized protein (TIGR03083 family)
VIDSSARAIYVRRLDWLDELITGFESFGPAELACPVPACPGWTVNNVLAHLARGILLLWITPATHADWSGLDLVALDRTLEGRPAAPLLPGAARALVTVLRSHQPTDPAAVLFGDQTFGALAGLVTTEMAIHLLDCQVATGRERTIHPAHAWSALDWTATTWLPTLVSEDPAPPPPGKLSVVATTTGFPVSVGTGEPAAELRGDAVDVLLALWGRRTDVGASGQPAVIAYWTGLTARTTAVAARD